jgi:arylsulfatase A-like enzyme
MTRSRTIGRAVLAFGGGALFACASPPGPARVPQHVVLVSFDTLRADHLGCYGYSRPTSPFLDRLAQRGVLFENAFSSCSHTSPAHASLFTGLYPSQHGVRRNGLGFPDLIPGKPGFRTLAELLAARGYDTAGFSGVTFLAPIARGFHSFDGAGGNWHEYRQADATVDASLRWLAARRPADRFLLFLHLFDAHLPHRAPDDCVRQLAFASPNEEEAFGRKAVEREGASPRVYGSRAELAREHARYDAEVRFADRELGRLFEAMEKAGFGDDTLWIVTADHGEGLGSHSYAGHGKYLYNEQLRIPLILYQGGQGPGARVSSLARHVDVLPTLLELLGASFEQPGFTLPGRSLVPALRAPTRPLPASFAFSERRAPAKKPRPSAPARGPDWEGGEMFSVQDLEWKYIVNTKGKGQLFDLRSDPLERHNLASSAEAKIKDRLRRLAVETSERAKREGQSVAPRPPDPAIQQELRALGYVQ